MKAHGMMNDNNNYDCYKMTFEKGVSLAIIGLIILMSIVVVIYSIFDATDTSPRWWVELYHDPMVFLALAYLLVNCLLFFWIFINKIQGRALIIAIVITIGVLYLLMFLLCTVEIRDINMMSFRLSAPEWLGGFDSECYVIDGHPTETIIHLLWGIALTISIWWPGLLIFTITCALIRYRKSIQSIDIEKVKEKCHGIFKTRVGH